jgi:multidrug efflux pump subunit AcrA (membrane-fusion protein)
VVVEVPQPSKTETGSTVLMPGTFVEVELGGRVVKDVYAIPRDAVHNRNEVWVVNGDKLHIKEINISRSDKDFAYTTDDIDADTIITSSIDVVVDGMEIRSEQEKTSSTELASDANT